MAIGFQGYRGMQQMQPMGVGNMRRGGIGGLRGNLRQGFNPMQMGMQAPQGMMPPQQFAMPQGRGAMPGSIVNNAMFNMAPAALTLASPMQPRPQQMAGMDAANVASQMQKRMAQEQALQARRLAPQQFGPMGGPGFAQPLSPPPSPQQFDPGPQVSLLAPQPLGGPRQQQQMQQQMLGGPQQQGGQAMGGAKWTMEIKPSEGMYAGGIITLAGGGQIPAYGLGGFLKKIGKAAAKLAPVAVGFIPGVSALSAPLQGLIGAGAKAASDLASADFDFDALDPGAILESGLGATFMAKAQQDPEWAAANASKIKALEDLSGGMAGGQGTDITGGRMMSGPARAGSPGASGARGGAGDPGTIAEVEEAASSQYNLFDQLGGRAGGGPVGSLYAMKRFGGGEVDGYRIGGLRERGRRGRRGRSPRARRPLRKSVRPPTRAPVQRAQPVAPPPPPMPSAPDMMPAIPDVMPVAPPPPVAPPLPPPAMAPPVMDTPVVGPPPPQPAPKAPIALPIPSIPATPEIPPTRGVDDGGMGGLEEVLPETTGERRRRRQASPDEGSGERREERRSGDSGRRREEAGELGGERAETTGGAEDTGRGTSKEEGRYQFGDRMTEEQKRMAERFATVNPEGMLTSGPDESAQIENIRAIAQSKPADDIASIEGTMIEPENVNDPTPTSLPGMQNPELLAQRDAELMATPVTYQRPPPPPPPALAQASESPIIDAPSGDRAMGQSALGLGDIFGAGASPFNMPTEAAQFEDPRMRAMLERMDAPEAPLETYVPEPEAQDKAEGGLIEELVGDETGMMVVERVAQALQDPENPESQGVIEEFSEAFGPEALQELMAYMQGGAQQAAAPPMQSGGKIPGNGDAMADDIRLIADRGTPDAQPIDISSGEFVVAGDVVSHLGSGNTDRGAAVLDQFQKDVRINRTGTEQQAPPIDLQEVLPGTFGDRYA